MSLKSAQSSYRDRTQEFLTVAEKLKKSYSSQLAPNGPSGSGGASKQEGPRSAVKIQSEFNKRASKIGFGIHQTSQKLAKLAKCKWLIRLRHCYMNSHFLCLIGESGFLAVLYTMPFCPFYINL